MRNNIYCTLATAPIKELAAKLGKNISVVNNLVSVWQSENNTTEIPTVEQAKERLQQSKSEIDEFYLAVPYAEVRDYNPDFIPIEHIGTTIYLTRFPKENAMEYFFNMFKHLPQLKSLIANPTEAYQFMLWREMAFIEDGISTQDKTSEAKKNADQRALNKATQYRKQNPMGKQSAALDDTLNAVRDWYQISKDHITSDKATHTYFIDGKPADFSVTQYVESIYGAPNFVGDYSHSAAIGNSIDTIARDFFEGRVDVNRTQYPNLNESRKSIVLGHLQRLRGYLDNRFGKGEYKVITTEFPIAASFDTPSGPKTVAGTMDMMVIDRSGNIHIFDFKVKNHPITQTYNGVQVNDARDYTAQQNMYRAILESLNPAFKGKVKSLQLVWFDTAYPKLRDAKYKTDEKDNVTVSDNEVTDQPLSMYPKFSTPSLKPNVTESIIPLHIANKILGLEVPKMNSLGLQRISGKPIQWARTSDNSYEVSSKGDRRFSALNATFKTGTYIDGVYVGGRTIEDVYQTVIKKSRKGQAPAQDSKLYNPELKTKEEREDFSYRVGYLPLWQEWAKQHPDLIEELRRKAAGKTLTDQFANTRVSQARALAEILNGGETNQAQSSTSSRPATATFGAELLGGQPQQQQTPQEAKIPEVGIERLHVNRESVAAKLARDFTPLERTMRVETLARTFSRKVDEAIQTLTEDWKKQISETDDAAEQQRLQDKIARITNPDRGRRSAIEEYTPNRIFDEMKQEWQGVLAMTEEEAKEDYGEEEGPRMLEAARKILDNFYPLLNEACTLIEGWEDIRIIAEQHDFHDGSTTRQTTDAEMGDSTETAERNEAENDDDTEGERVNGSEGWSFKVRYVDPHTTISKKVKRILSDIALEGVNGLEYDDLGNLRYLNAQTAYMAIMDGLSGMIDADDFSVKNDDGTWSFPALEKMRGKHPWIGQVINTLETDPSLISSFFTAFRKDFIPYWMQYFDEAAQAWRTYAMNAPVALDSSMTDTTRNYEMGIKLDNDSLYGVGGVVNRENAAIGQELAKTLAIYTQDYGESDYDDISEKLAKGLRMVGFNVVPQNVVAMLEAEDGHNDFNKVVNALRSVFTNVADGTLKDGEHLITENNEEFKTIASIIGEVSDLSNVSSVRQGDKTLYSYSAPNYINTLVKTLKSDRFERFLDEQFGAYKWFKEGDTWMSGWLEELATSKETRSQLELKELKYLGDKEYTEWTPNEIKTHFLMEYYSIPKNRSTKKQYAWYNFPIFSDSPVAMFIKFTKESGEGYQDRLVANMRKVVLQELGRIKLVRDRRKKIANGEISPIVNFDKNGDKFHFFPELNANGGAFLREVEQLSAAGKIKELYTAIDEAVRGVMSQNFNNFFNKLSETDLADMERFLVTEGIITGKEEFRGAVEEYYWNQTYASSQIIELTTTDLAFYKNGTDFQKRYKEVYAAGDKLNTNSEYGRKEERTLYIADQIVTSSSFVDIRESLDRAVAGDRIKDFDRDNILNKFKDINVADAQALRSPSSFRAVLDMLGKWDDKMQKAMDNFESGEWDMEDFNVVWQTIKPFVYSQIPKPDGFGSTIKVPHQNKNSEFLLLSLYQTIAGPIGRSPKLQAITEFMEKNNIDVVQFESAVKAGGQGVININYSEPKLVSWVNNVKNTEAAKSLERALKKVNPSGNIETYDGFKEANDLLLEQGRISQETYNERMKAIEPDKKEVLAILNDHVFKDGKENPEVVHTIPYSDYVIQQPTPEHLFDAEAVFGSQFRNLIIADLPDNFTVRLGNMTLNKEQVVRLYQSNIVENLLEDYTKLKGKFATIESFQQEMLRQIKGNPKYGRDMINAMEIVEIIHPLTKKPTKVFNIPMNNPSTTAKLQELVMSMFKNRITKQHINGGACIMVSDFGLTDQLHVVYNKEGDKSSGIKGIECYLPAYSKKFYEALMKTDENGNRYLDINELPDDLRRAVGYRIPTEDKYSMAPLIIKGFLPQQNGSSIMLPADITTLAGSDFDVDKMFLMLPAFKVQRYDMQAARRAFEKVDNSAMKALELMFKSILGSEMSEEEKLELLASEENDFKKFFQANKDKFLYERPKVVKVTYDARKALTDPEYLEKLPRDARNNMVIDIAYGILSHPDTAEKINNPGSFDKLKVAARIANIVTDPLLMQTFMTEFNISGVGSSSEDARDKARKAVVAKLLDMSRKGQLKELSKFVEKYTPERNSLTPDTFVYNHRQNMTGAALIGMYANNTTSQAKFQFTNLGIAERYSFVINGKKVSSLHDDTSELGGRISKMCANFSAASVDNVKDPVLASIMQNTKTANIAATLIRAGIGIEEVGLLFSQPIIRSTIEADGSLTKLNRAIGGYIDALKMLEGDAPDKKLARTIDYTSDMLLENCINGIDFASLPLAQQKEFLISQINVGRLFTQAIIPIADDIAELTRVSRADSPNAAIATSLAGAKLQTHRVKRLMDRKGTREFTLVGLEGVLDAKVNPKMSRAELRSAFFKSKMPMLQAFYSLGIDFGTSIASEYFPQANEFTDMLVNKILNNAPISLFRGKNGERVLNAFYDEAVRFGLSKTTLFGDEYNSDGSLKISFNDKRDYYLYDYPAKFLEAISSNPEVGEIPAIKKLEVVNGEIVMRRSGRLTPASREMIMNAFDQLLYMDGTITVTEDGKKVEKPVQQLAVDLFMYSFYKEGLKFGPNSFGYFMSTQFLTSFPEFITALREMHYDMRNGTYFDKYLDQFYANHFMECVPSIRSQGDDMKPVGTIMPNGNLSLPAAVVMNRNGEVTLPDGRIMRGSYERIIYDEKLYKITNETVGNTSYVEYEPMPTFDVLQDGLRYDANRTVVEMKGIITDESRRNKAKTVNSKAATQQVPQSLMDAIDAGFSLPEGFEEQFDDSFMSGLEALEEKYTIEEGQQQLETPMCGV